MNKLPIDFKVGPVLLEKGSDISILKEQIKDAVAANQEAENLWQADLRFCIHQLNNSSPIQAG